MTWLSIEKRIHNSVVYNTIHSVHGWNQKKKKKKGCKMNSHKIRVMCQDSREQSRVTQVKNSADVQSSSMIVSWYIRYSSIYRLLSETHAGLNCWILVSVALEHDSQGYADFDSAASSSLQWLAGKMLRGSKSAILKKMLFPQEWIDWQEACMHVHWRPHTDFDTIPGKISIFDTVFDTTGRHWHNTKGVTCQSFIKRLI